MNLYRAPPTFTRVLGFGGLLKNGLNLFSCILLIDDLYINQIIISIVNYYFVIKLQCNPFLGADDFVEVAGGNGFELGFLNVRARYCGMAANVGKYMYM